MFGFSNIYHQFSNNSPNEFQCTSNLFGIKYTVGIYIYLFPRAEVAAPCVTTISYSFRGCKCSWICVYVCAFAVILMSMHTCVSLPQSS